MAAGVSAEDARRAIDTLEARYPSGRLPALPYALREALAVLKTSG